MSQAAATPPAPFIIGVGRSGTTLLRLMLDAHSQLAIPAETSFLPRLAEMFADNEEDRERYFAFVTQSKVWPDFGLDAADYWDALGAVRPFRLSDAVREFYRLYARRHGKSRFGDKTPAHLGRVAAVQALVPEARFIHVIRDGRDVALSLRDVWFGRNRSVQELITKWRRAIERARENKTLCRWYMELRYEDLVRQPDEQLRRICDFVELDFEPGMLRYYERAEQRLDEVTTRYNDDGAVLVAKEERLFQHRFTSSPPLESRLFRYQSEMSSDVQKECEEIAGRLLAELGYKIDA